MSSMNALNASIQTALKKLQSSEPVAIPTETVYGLAAPINDEKALKAVFKIKKRPFFDPLIVHVSDESQLKNVSARPLSDMEKKLTQYFWPGPLSLVLPKHPGLNPLITSGLPTVAVRMPKSELTLELIKSLNVPLAAPSANLFGKTSPTRPEHVKEEFGGQVHCLDGGPCEVGLESTVLEVCEETKIIKIYRPGCVSAGDIRSMFDKNSITKWNVISHESPVSPGHLKHHYMPKIPLILAVWPSTKLPQESNKLRPELLQFIQDRIQLKSTSHIKMSLSENPILAARQLYHNLREAASTPHTDFIWLDWPKERFKPNSPWEALSNRLEKAATLVVNSGPS